MILSFPKKVFFWDRISFFLKISWFRSKNLFLGLECILWKRGEELVNSNNFGKTKVLFLVFKIIKKAQTKKVLTLKLIFWGHHS